VIAAAVVAVAADGGGDDGGGPAAIVAAAAVEAEAAAPAAAGRYAVEVDGASLLTRMLTVFEAANTESETVESDVAAAAV
jgi:hypothetical protein